MEKRELELRISKQVHQGFHLYSKNNDSHLYFRTFGNIEGIDHAWSYLILEVCIKQAEQSTKSSFYRCKNQGPGVGMEVK